MKMKSKKWFHPILVSVLGILLCSSMALATKITFDYRIQAESRPYIFLDDGLIFTSGFGNVGGSLTADLTGPGFYSKQALLHDVWGLSIDPRGGYSHTKPPDSVNVELVGYLYYSLFHDSWPVSPFPESTFVHLSVQANGNTIFEKSLTSVAEEFHVPLTVGYVTLPLNWEYEPIIGDWLVSEGHAETPIDFLFSLDVRVVPVPATLVLLASGLVGLAGWRLKFKR
jgi:hypothetical protein